MDVSAPMTPEEREARLKEIALRLAEIDSEYANQALPQDVYNEFNSLVHEEKEQRKILEEIEARKRLVEEAASHGSTESGAHFNVVTRKTEADIYDLASLRIGLDNPTEARPLLQDNAKRAVERAVFPHDRADREDNQGRIEKLIEGDDRFGSFARHILLTGSPTYQRAFGKYLAGERLNGEEERVMSLTTASGGAAVPFVLDPTIIFSSDGALNPFRQISRVEQIMVDEWRGITSAGVTAAFQAELAEVSDAAPTLAQPSVSTEMARAFVPYSIEIGMDYPNFANELARALQDSKDVLEASKFAVGTGTNEPQGIIVGATGLVTASTRGSVTSTDIYALDAALPTRFRTRAVWAMPRAVMQKIRQFDTSGGAQLWYPSLPPAYGTASPNQGRVSADIFGYGVYEASQIVSVLTTGNKVAVLGDFNHYLIADRIGLQVETVQHIFSSGNLLPRAERGVFAYWRVGAGVLVTNAFRVYIL